MYQLLLHHVDTLTSCKLPMEGLLPFTGLNVPALALLRVPIHQLNSVSSHNGAPLHGAPAMPQADADVWEGNPMSTIVEWRSVIVVGYGCPGTQNSSVIDTFGCTGRLPYATDV